MRGRPKIVLARTYEEALDLYNKYKNNILGIVSDARFPREGKIDPQAGIRFLTVVRSESPFIPLILQSAEIANREFAQHVHAQFIDKNSGSCA